MNLHLEKSDDKGDTYNTGEFKLVYRKKGSISGDNEINPAEKILLIAGEAEVIILDKSSTYTAPTLLEIPAKTYHKLTALTDITFLIFEN